MSQATAPRKPADFKVKSSARKKMIVELVGEKYEIRAPKAYAMLRFASINAQGENGEVDTLAMAEAIDSWITQAFGKEGKKAVEDRLNDPDDDLDIEHIMDLMTQVAEVSAPENPTT